MTYRIGDDETPDRVAPIDWQYNSGYEDGRKSAKEEIKRLRTELDTYKKDAERYRWLRVDPGTPDLWGVLDELGCVGEKFDAAIDAAMRSEK